jgi:hypothetical protein
MLDTIPTDVLLYLGAWLRFSEVLVLRSVSKSFRDRLTVQRILSTRPGFEKLAFSEYVWFEDKSYGHYRSGGTKKMLFSSFSESRNEEISSIGINFSAGVHRLVYDHEDGCGQCNCKNFSVLHRLRSKKQGECMPSTRDQFLQLGTTCFDCIWKGGL